MRSETGRYAESMAAAASEGWSLIRLTPPSRLHGANGLRTGPDGRIYVAQVPGSQISAVDIDSGEIETISPMGGAIIAPDDLAFDEDGNLYITEITEGRVSMLGRDGQSRVLAGDMPVANPITFHQGRLIAGECRMDARIMELDRNGGTPRVILDGLPMVNAFAVGPDGMLYFPLMHANEIWRVSLDGGTPEVVANDLGVPDSVKFDAKGRIVTTQVGSGQVLRIDPRTGEKTVLAELAPGLDNCTFVGERLFVSHISGAIHEILDEGRTRPLIDRGLQWPLGLAVDETGRLFIADGVFTYDLRPGEALQLAGTLFTPGFPGYTRGVYAEAPGQYVVTTANGDVARYWPGRQESEVLGSGFERLMGVAVGPGGAAIVAEYGTGRVLSLKSATVSELAVGLDQPMGVAIASDGAIYIAESGAGRVVKLAGGSRDTVCEGLGKPEGIALRAGLLYVVDTQAKELVAVDLGTGARVTIASHLPVGAPRGIVPKRLGAIGDMAGPMIPFAGIAIGSDGAIFLSGDAEGSVLAIRAAC